MTLKQIQRKTQELNAKTGRALLRGIAVALLAAGISGYGIAQAGGTALRAAFAFAIAWGLAGQFFIIREIWQPVLPAEAALSPGIESYRLEVERQRYLSSRFLLWSLGPVILAVGALIALILSLGSRNRGMATAETLLKMIPFLSLILIWIVGVFVIRVRQRHQLQREIDELHEIERVN